MERGEDLVGQLEAEVVDIVLADQARGIEAPHAHHVVGRGVAAVALLAPHALAAVRRTGYHRFMPRGGLER